MAEANIKTFRAKITDWNENERTLTMTPQNWSLKKNGPLNADNLRKFLKAQWPANTVIHSIEEVKAVVDVDAFVADRLSPDARPRVVEA